MCILVFIKLCIVIYFVLLNSNIPFYSKILESTVRMILYEKSVEVKYE